MKQKKYPLWMLKLLYSKFSSGFLKTETKNWKELGVDLDGDIIFAKRRFSRHIDKIFIDLKNEGDNFTILKKHLKGVLEK